MYLSNSLAEPPARFARKPKPGFSIGFRVARKPAVFETRHFWAGQDDPAHYGFKKLWPPCFLFASREAVDRQAREIRARIAFCDAAGVHASKDLAALGYVQNALDTAADHAAVFRNRDGRMVAMLEPYRHGRQLRRLEDFAVQHGWTIAALPRDCGIYWPGHTACALLAPPHTGWTVSDTRRYPVTVCGVELTPDLVSRIVAALRKCR